MNLLRFFDKWGFLDEMDATISDYSKQPICITKADADKVRKEVKALGYSEPEDNVEYISDNTVDMFRNNVSMTPGTASVSGNNITVSGGSGVATYEVQDSQGKVIYVSVNNEFTVTNGLPLGWVLKAVPCRGEKVTVKK